MAVVPLARRILAKVALAIFVAVIFVLLWLLYLQWFDSATYQRVVGRLDSPAFVPVCLAIVLMVGLTLVTLTGWKKFLGNNKSALCLIVFILVVCSTIYIFVFDKMGLWKLVGVFLSLKLLSMLDRFVVIKPNQLARGEQ